ncbi:glycosyltransferase family 2 protein [Undibacterium terreum]|uniref:Glycosyl transferase n=1 Tax=Undibacterium terreum TaxID=1224302 RepID=A0A916V107_9BURK|nr:glycosyltransferase family 2 protein [Undibacterium terreum]GGC97901.1 glycosyl transferase [Undibacterium terreum]
MLMIDIALASYNGEKYISEQIDSILSSELDASRFALKSIIVSDNRSTDRTADIVTEIAQRHDKVKLTINEKRGVINNFNHALTHSTADYIMLSDQDDIWQHNKILLSMQKLLEMEEAHGKDCPLLVFTDLAITDSRLNTVQPSFFDYMKIKPEGYQLPANIFLSNVAPGCTMIFNRKLLEMAMPVPEQAAMHDWWLILVATTFGKVGHVDQATIFYRQHEGNQVGARRSRYWEMLLRPRAKCRMAKNSLEMAARQALAFKKRFGLIPHSSMGAINFLITFSHLRRLERIRGLVAGKIGYRTFFGNGLLYLLALMLPVSK